MIDRLIQWSLQYRAVVVTVSFAFLAWGAYVASEMPLDVLPDLTAPTVTVIAEGKGMVPQLRHRQGPVVGGGVGDCVLIIPVIWPISRLAGMVSGRPANHGTRLVDGCQVRKKRTDQR